MPVKYVDERTGEFLKGALVGTGAPSAYGIKTPNQLVATSLAASGKLQDDIFFKKNAGRKNGGQGAASKAVSVKKNGTNSKVVSKRAPKVISKAHKKMNGKNGVFKKN